MAKARTVGIGMDYSATSKAAIRWAVDNLIDGGDRLILIHVEPPKADHTRKQLFEDTGSRMSLVSSHVHRNYIVFIFIVFIYYFIIYIGHISIS